MFDNVEALNRNRAVRQFRNLILMKRYLIKTKTTPTYTNQKINKSNQSKCLIM